MLLQASPHPVAMDWQHRSTRNGGLSHNLHRDAASTLCRGLQTNGLTSHCVEVYPFLGDNLQAICTKLFYMGLQEFCSNINWANSNIIDFGGLKDSANASKQLNTVFIYPSMIPGMESVAGCQWYTRDAVAASNTSQAAVGTSTSTGQIMLGGWINVGTRESGSIANTTTLTAGGTTTRGAGFHAAQNNNNRTTQYYLDGVAIGGVSAAGTGTWAANATGRLFSQASASYWKRDLLYASFTTQLPAASVLQLSRVVRTFQRSLNRAA